MEWRFGADTSGYGAVGVSETMQGKAVSLEGTSFPISDFDPACASGAALEASTRRALPGPSDVPGVAIASAGSRYGLIDLFRGTIRGSLNLHMSFRSAVRAACGGAATTTKLIDPGGGVSPAPPMPVAYDGRFKISPAITADGRLRIGTMTIDDVQQPQADTFAYVASCTAPYGTPDDSSCFPGDGDGALFPARVKLLKLTAELIVGSNAPG